MTDARPCTCAPDERPYPCQHQYALGLCRKAEIRSLRVELDRCIARIEGLTKERDKWIECHRQLMDPIIRAKMLEPSPPMICDANVPGLIAENDLLRHDLDRCMERDTERPQEVERLRELLTDISRSEARGVDWAAKIREAIGDE